LSDSNLSDASFFGGDGNGGRATGFLKDGDTLKTGNLTFKVIHTPGHTKGGISLFLEEEKLLFCGDTLFLHSIGRTDFPGGSYQQIIDSIKNRLLVLGDDVTAFPGHGPETTLGEERARNPFLRP
jgi:glyoxylase-like metal-dependent hydrolase (beta-lactamase superfamily II)